MRPPTTVGMDRGGSPGQGKDGTFRPARVPGLRLRLGLRLGPPPGLRVNSTTGLNKPGLRFWLRPGLLSSTTRRMRASGAESTGGRIR